MSFFKVVQAQSHHIHCDKPYRNTMNMKQLEKDLWESADDLWANSKLPLLPNLGDIESKAVLKKATKAHQALAELKGVVASIPNHVLVNKNRTLC
jgi:hypothetical protein